MKALAIVLFGIMLISGCNNFDEVEEEFPEFGFDEAAIQDRLQGTWEVDRIAFDNLDVTSEYEGFTLTFNDDDTWSAANGAPLFASAGQFELIEEDVILFDQSIEASIAFPIDNSQSIMTLSVNTNGATIGGRTTGLSGEYVIGFSKQL